MAHGLRNSEGEQLCDEFIRAREQRRPRSLLILITAAGVGLVTTTAAVVIVVCEFVDAVNGNWSFDPIGMVEIFILVAIPIQLWRHRDKYL